MDLDHVLDRDWRTKESATCIAIVAADKVLERALRTLWTLEAVLRRLRHHVLGLVADGTDVALRSVEEGASIALPLQRTLGRRGRHLLLHNATYRRLPAPRLFFDPDGILFGLGQYVRAQAQVLVVALGGQVRVDVLPRVLVLLVRIAGRRLFLLETHFGTFWDNGSVHRVGPRVFSGRRTLRAQVMVLGLSFKHIRILK